MAHNCEHGKDSDVCVRCAEESHDTVPAAAASSPVKTEIKNGDCLDVLADYPDNTFDLIMTSPPYADKRKDTYGGVVAEKYVEWFLPRGEQFLRVIKPTGTFILNIKEKPENGERHTFVIELILALRKQ